jgi:hypothetical protein
VNFISNIKPQLQRLIWWANWRQKQADLIDPKVQIFVDFSGSQIDVADYVRELRAQSWANLAITTVAPNGDEETFGVLSGLAAATPELNVEFAGDGFGARVNDYLATGDFDYFLVTNSSVRPHRNAISKLIEVAESTGAPVTVAEFINSDQVDAPFDWQRGGFSLNTRLIRADFAIEKKLNFTQPSWLVVLQLHLATKNAEFMSDQIFESEVAGHQLSLSELKLATKLISKADAKQLVAAGTYRRWLSFLISSPLQKLVADLGTAPTSDFDDFKAVASEFLSDADEEIWVSATGVNRAAVWAAVHGSREQTLKQLTR